MLYKRRRENYVTVRTCDVSLPGDHSVAPLAPLMFTRPADLRLEKFTSPQPSLLVGGLAD